MAEKIKILFPEIIEKLHKIAKTNAEKEYGLLLDNTLFNEEGKLISAKGGSYGILMKTPDDKPAPDIEQFLKTMQTYVFYFVGKEESGYVKKEHLSPIVKTMTEKSDEKTNTNEAVMESFHPEQKKILGLLFEEDAKEVNPQVPDNEQTNNDSRRDAINPDFHDITIGYRSNFELSIQGSKDGTYGDSFTTRTKGIWGGVLADLRNMKFEVGGEKIQIGKMFDWQKLKELAGYVDIDVDNVAHDVRNAFDQRYPNSDVNTKIWETQELITSLNRKGKLTSDIKAKLTPNQYALTIQVWKEDPNYPKYNQKLIAKICSDAFGTAETLTNRNKVSEDEVILIKDCNDDDKIRSTYSQVKRSKDDVTKKQKKIDESIDFDNTYFYDNNGKSVEIQEIIEESANELKNQVGKEFGKTVTDSGVTYSQKFVDLEVVKKINDEKIKEQVKSKYLYVYYLTAKLNRKETKVYESFEDSVTRKLLDIYKLTEDETTKEFDAYLADYHKKVKKVFQNTAMIVRQSNGTEGIDTDFDVTRYEIEKDGDYVRYLFVGGQKKRQESKNDADDPTKTDLYIVSKKNMKKLDRKYDSKREEDGTVVSKTSNEEYK